MSMLTKLTFAVTNQTPLSLSVMDIVSLSTDEQMVWIDAKRVIAMVTSFLVLFDFNALVADGKTTDDHHPAVPSPHWIVRAVDAT